MTTPPALDRLPALAPIRALRWPARVASRVSVGAIAAPLMLFLVALGVRAWAASTIDFPPTEGSAYYFGVARNVVEGRGLVTDALWAYATPPLVFPRPAFELWMPLASLIAAIPMAIIGATFAVAQLSSVVVGATVGPLAWFIGRDAARRHGLDARRTASVAFTSGLGAALAAPLLGAAMGPDSSTPFTVMVVVASLFVPGALAGRMRAALALGAAMGLAYLARQEAMYLGAAFLVLLIGVARRVPAERRAALVARALGVPVLVGAAVVVPWLLRNLTAFHTLFPGQALENAYITANEQIFAYAHRPTAAGFLAQGPAVMLGNIAEALRTNVVDTLVVPAAPLVILGTLAIVLMRRSPALRSASPLVVLLLSGTLTFLATSILFPVATRWGTFLHASGPLLVGLGVAAALGIDGAVAWISARRQWAKPNVLLPALLIAGLGLPLAGLHVQLLATQTASAHDDLRAMASAVAAQPEAAHPTRPIVTDHPIWLAEAMRRSTLALPDESPADVWRLTQDFGAPLVAILDTRGRYPAAFVAPAGADPSTTTCFVERPVPASMRALAGTDRTAAPRLRLFAPTPECRPR